MISSCISLAYEQVETEVRKYMTYAFIPYLNAIYLGFQLLYFVKVIFCPAPVVSSLGLFFHPCQHRLLPPPAETVRVSFGRKWLCSNSFGRKWPWPPLNQLESKWLRKFILQGLSQRRGSARIRHSARTLTCLLQKTTRSQTRSPNQKGFASPTRQFGRWALIGQVLPCLTHACRTYEFSIKYFAKIKKRERINKHSTDQLIKNYE